MKTRPAHKATWRRSPQRVWLRRAVFQVHLWLGLVLALYAIVIGVSGSALVFKDEIGQALHPELFRVAPQPQPLPLAPTIRAVEQGRPGWRVASLKDFVPAQPLTLLLRPAGGTLPLNYRIVTVQPYTGQVLADRLRFAGVLGFLGNLHFYLCAGRTGLLVSGWMSLGLVLLCVTGLVVWWPGVSRWAAALLLRRRASWQRYTWDLHAVAGFWFALPLLLLSFTGCYFAFPAPVAALLDAVTLSHPPAERAPAASPKHAAAGAPLTVDEAFARARQLLPAQAPIGYFALPSRPGGAYYATGYYTGAAPFSALVSLQIDAQTGAMLHEEDTRRDAPSRRLIQKFFAWHFGSFAGAGAGGIAVKLLWVLAGLAPALLAVTGVILFAWRKLRHWWRRPARSAEAQRQAPEARPASASR